jgi:hypothetical protein
MNNPSPPGRQTIKLPIQARPVHRDGWTAPAAREPASGMQAAQSECSDLRGLARQMCYAAQYGVSV